MRSRIYFLTFIIMPSFFLCQAPGYMGKKTTVGGGVHFNPVTLGSTANNKTLFGNGGSAEEGHFRLNVTYDVFMERVISKRWLFGTSVKYIRTGYDNRSSVLSANSRSPQNYYQINALCINPYFKHYSRRYPAPLGRYVFIGPSINILFTRHDNYMHIVDRTTEGHDTLTMNFGPQKQTHISADLIFGVGKSRIIKDKILIDYGYNFGIVSAFYTVEALNTGLMMGSPSRDEYIAATARARLRNATRFNLYLRVAYIF